MWQETILNALLYSVPLLLAVVAHEVAHGLAAEKRGDPTARMQGRITMNPLVHVDLVGTILLPGILIATRSPFLFGWAKPVPVDLTNLKGGRRDMALVSAAGPLSNLVLACLSALTYRGVILAINALGSPPELLWVLEPLMIMAAFSATFNLTLMVINLLPIPPLDGGRILMGLLPPRLAVQLQKVEPYGVLILLLLIAGGVADDYVLEPVLTLFMRLIL